MSGIVHNVPRVAVLMGSESDRVKMEPACGVLRKLGISFTFDVMSAHRDPAKVMRFAQGARAEQYSVIICGAGMAAHLAGAVAANTDLPVIGVPLSGGIGGGQDALFATVQMPSGVPVATVGIDGAANAAWLAARILGVGPGSTEHHPAPDMAVSPDALVARSVVARGKTKTLWSTQDPHLLIMQFNDDVTANNGEKHEVAAGKGESTCAFNAAVMQVLKTAGIPTHFVDSGPSPNTAVVQRLRMIPLECVIRNQAAGSLCSRIGVKKGMKFDPPLYELFYKSDEFNDPLVGEGTAIAFGWSDKAQLGAMEVITRRVNTEVSALLRKSGIQLVDYKIEFGVDHRGRLVVGDEFSPDSCRMWDEATGESLDKDLFRKGLGGFLEAYRAVVGRLAATAEAGEGGEGAEAAD